MARRLTFERIATTEDTGDPVIHATFSDVGSFANIVVDQEDELLRVTHVDSEVRGDMKRILDEVVEQIGWTRVRFMLPLDDMKAEGTQKLIDRLNGFEKMIEEVESPDGDTMKVDSYDGEWKIEANDEERDQDEE